MQIGIPAETRAGETRVAATPETVKKMLAAGHKIFIEKGAGTAACYPDQAYEEAGAQLVDAASLYQQAQLILKVRAPQDDELKQMNGDTVLVGLLSPFDQSLVTAYQQQGITAFAMEKLPRTSRAQSMDVLSSQANIAGYKAVLLAAFHYQRFMPMLMTAAGTVKAARVLILGAGVAGLQAIATAKRLGAVVEASDVRPAAKEQVMSLGAKFVDVPFETDEEREIAEGVGGYARPMPASWMKRQSEQVAERAKQADIVITTALIPGRPAPVLLHEETVKQMKPGAVVVDMAIENGGNCPLTERDQVVVKHGVTLIGQSNLPASVANDSSSLYARNLMKFIELLSDKETAELMIDLEDDLVAGSLLCRQGKPVEADKE